MFVDYPVRALGKDSVARRSNGVRAIILAETAEHFLWEAMQNPGSIGDCFFSEISSDNRDGQER